MATLILSVPFYNQALYTGSFARTHPEFGDITFIVSFFIAGVIYMLLTAPAAVNVPVAAE